jgi:hypothetical protein
MATALGLVAVVMQFGITSDVRTYGAALTAGKSFGKSCFASGGVATSSRMTSVWATRFSCQMNGCTPEVVKAMHVALKETGPLKLFSANISVISFMEKGRGVANGGFAVGTIIKPKLGLQPKPFGKACFAPG